MKIANDNINRGIEEIAESHGNFAIRAGGVGHFVKGVDELGFAPTVAQFGSALEEFKSAGRAL